MKSQGFARHGLATLVMGLAALQAGCAGKYTGGGWTDSVDGFDKASVAFNVHAKDGDGNGEADEFKGQLEFQDHGVVLLEGGAFPKGIKLHGEVIEGGYLFSGTLWAFSGTGIVVDGVTGEWGAMTGTYTPQPKNLGPGGTFEALVCNGGTPGPDDDWISIALVGGVYDGYAINAYLLGGNIQYHPEEE